VRKLFGFFLVLVFLFAIVNGSQAVVTAKIAVLGISDRDVALDTTDIYTKNSTGLGNIGVGETIYLAGNPGDTTITTWTWSLTIPPQGSAATLSSTDQPVVSLIPDRDGKFSVTLSVASDSGNSDPVTYVVSSGKYVGVGGFAGEPEGAQCAACHNGDSQPDKVTEWKETKHAKMFTDGINGVKSPTYKASCIRCHVVGYDKSATNNGFDEVAAAEGWTFPDTPLVATNWDNMVENYPNSANMANIQCENCHGPGSRHNSAVSDNKIVVSYESGVCAKCHDSGTHHFRPYQWDNSLHSHPVDESGRADCVKCHTGLGFIDNLAGVADSLIRTEYLPITCVTCHDPHAVSNDNHQLRTTEAYTLMNGEVADVGFGNLCINCHHSRRNVDTYAGVYNRRYSPHYGPQGDMLVGTGGVEYGQEIESSPHATILDDGCVDCHMAPGIEDAADPSWGKLGDHSFAMKTEDGVEHTEVCVACHGEIESFEAIMPEDDWDEDGTIESVSAEIQGLMDRLALNLPPVGEAKSSLSIDSTWTSDQLKAAYNYLFVKEDKSRGVHNADYARGILLAAIGSLGVEQVNTPAPYDWSLNAPYPNPFNSMTSFTYTLAKDSHVSIRVFDLMGREVSNVVSGNQKAGAYRRVMNLAGQPSGIYMLQLAASGFSATKKIVLMK